MSVNTKHKKPRRSRTTAASTFTQVAVEDAQPSAYISDFGTKASAPQAANGLNNQRYVESSKMAVSTGAETPHDPSLDVLADHEAEGALDANLAEMSLGERLAARNATAVNGTDGHEQASGSDDEKLLDKQGKRKKKRAITTVPSHSLTRMLIQALHAGDASLLEACLNHSDEALIKNTVMRLPPQLAVPLLTACVERLGRGARGNGIKGRGGGASAQRGMALIKWIRAVLIIHGGHLMTMPDLIARLSHLHSTLTTRLTLQERLLSLSGRLDLVLSQVELRSSNAPAPLPSKRKNTKKRGKLKIEPTKYIEGESSSEQDEKDTLDGVSGEEGGEIEEDDEEGSIEDVELGGSEEDLEEEEEDEDDEDEESDDEDNLVNGFIDDEASEDYEEDESEDESE